MAVLLYRGDSTATVNPPPPPFGGLRVVGLVVEPDPELEASPLASPVAGPDVSSYHYCTRKALFQLEVGSRGPYYSTDILLWVPR